MSDDARNCRRRGVIFGETALAEPSLTPSVKMSFREFHSSLSLSLFALRERERLTQFREGLNARLFAREARRSSLARTRVSSEKPALERTRVCGRCSLRGYTKLRMHSAPELVPRQLLSFSLSPFSPLFLARSPPIPRTAIRVYERLLYNGAGIITVGAFQKNKRDYN